MNLPTQHGLTKRCCVKSKPMKAFKAWVIAPDQGKMPSDLFPLKRGAKRMARENAFSWETPPAVVPVLVTPIVKRKAFPKAGRKMTAGESRKHADKKYGEAFKKLAQDERKAKK
jgi:hypothetical protein